MRLGLLIGALALALFVGVISLQTPSPRGLTASPTDFSAARAMIDVREIAQRPHPVGSADHQRVQDYLVGRMTALGLTPALQVGEMSQQGSKRLTKWGLDATALPVNIVGILPGRNTSAPAVLLMAHYDTVAKSPGAADDTAGVAAILEAVRAIKARGPAERDLIVLMTDAEELGLDGAASYFKASSVPAHIGAVINLEARGGGGRAMMFETGPGNRQTIDLFARSSARADGGATSNSMAVLVYEQMPNGTDFTISRQKGIAGINLAFIGRPSQYHSPSSTPGALDQGSVQHIGSQALEAADAFIRSPALPIASQNSVYADVLGHGFISHSPALGWVLLALAAALAGFAFWRGRGATGLSFADVGRGVLGGAWMLAAGLVLAKAVRLLAGPLSSRAETPDTYYVLLARLPWIEGGVALCVLAVGLAALAGPAGIGRRVLAGVILVAALVATLMGGVDPVLLGAAVVALGLGLWSQSSARSPWGGWLGLILLVLVLGV
ncbi:MAG: peptidase, partial [Brevundimonas sp.]|nr:peptidase [Brevundimonas sp.]